MQKTTGYIILLLLYLLCTADKCLGQLQIGGGTTWVSTSQTVVVLNDMGLKYNGTLAALLNNIFRFTGRSGSYIGGGIQPYIYAISLAKTNPGKLFLARSANVKKRINFETGLFDLNGYNIILDSNALLTNENELSRIIGPIGGTVDINVDLNAPTTANPGNLGAIITSTNNLGKMNLIRGHKPQYIKDSSLSIARFYDLTVKDNLTFSANLRFSYFDQETKGFNKDSLVLWRSPDAVKWTDIGYTTKDTSKKYVEKQGLKRLNLFTLYPLAKTSTIPPIIPVPDIILLIGNWYNNVALLNWWIVSEYQANHFSIERKYASEAAFTAIATVPAMPPGSNRSFFGDYTFTDWTVKKGPDNIFYRIHQSLTNGQEVYSNIITLKAKNGGTFIQKLFPTIAVGGRIYIEVGDMELKKMSFLILDTKGRIIQTGILSYQSQWLPVNFQSNGLYQLVLLSGDQKFYSSFIK